MSCTPDYKIRYVPEDFRFSSERRVMPAGQNYVRAMNIFSFIKNGKLLRFNHDDIVEGFWEGVEVRGFVAPLGGAARHHRQAGWWDWRNFKGTNGKDHGGKDVQYMKLDKIVGLYWETDDSWRGG
ncbi:hypothetical protein FRC12_022289 [Ceratobasidium sp. 428]|nr:hypothetical protein FRC12_022289 [Ceratobasidium sp. 428]